MMQAIGDLFTYDFMRRALFGVLLMMPLFSLLGTLVVNNGMAFFSDALGHSALTGAAIGLLFGLADPSPVMLVFAIVFALLMNTVRHSRLSSTDTVIGVFASCGKYIQVLAYLISAAVASALGGDLAVSVGFIIEACFGAALSLCVPKSLSVKVGRMFSPPVKTVSENGMKKSVTMLPVLKSLQVK